MLFADVHGVISNSSSLKPVIPYARDRLRQVDDSPNAYPVRVKYEINQPRVAEIFIFQS